MLNSLNTEPVDDCASNIAVIGGGLSSASVVYGLLKRLLDNAGPKSPLKITIFEKTDNLWTGVPYGDLAETDFFLIETLEETDCPLFDSWIKRQPRQIAAYAMHSSPVVKEWYENNRKRIDEGDIGSLYFPRKLFGLFVYNLLQEVITQAEQHVNLDITWIKQEVSDIELLEPGYFRVSTEQNLTLFADRLVIAVGSIPQRRPFNVPESITTDPNYISDSQICAYFDLNRRLRHSLGDQGSAKRIAIIGSAASAIETIFFISKNENIRKRIGQITVISTSGRLVGGLHAENFSEIGLPDYVLLRRSSDIYTNAAQALSDDGILKIVKAKVVGVNKLDDRFHLILERDGKETAYAADIIVNCSGCGSVDNTTSVLINNLSQKLPVNEERRGFNVNTFNEVDEHPGLFVVGPLLNRSFSGKQAESISAVFREGNLVAEALAKDLSADLRALQSSTKSAVV